MLKERNSIKSQRSFSFFVFEIKNKKNNFKFSDLNFNKKNNKIRFTKKIFMIYFF